jgi:hypothetical protein
MIETGTLMLGKGILTASVLLGFGFSQLRALRRMKAHDEAQRRAAQEQESAQQAPGLPERADSPPAPG